MAGTINLLNSSSVTVQSQELLSKVYLSNNRNKIYYFKIGAGLGRVEQELLLFILGFGLKKNSMQVSFKFF